MRYRGRAFSPATAKHEPAGPEHYRIIRSRRHRTVRPMRQHFFPLTRHHDNMPAHLSNSIPNAPDQFPPLVALRVLECRRQHAVAPLAVAADGLVGQAVRHILGASGYRCRRSRKAGGVSGHKAARQAPRPAGRSSGGWFPLTASRASPYGWAPSTRRQHVRQRNHLLAGSVPHSVA